MKTITETIFQLSPTLRNKYWFWLLVLGSFLNTTAQKFEIIEAKRIISQIKKGKPINIENVEIKGDLDFTKVGYFRETKQNARVFIETPISFKNCKFRGQIIGFKEINDLAIASTFTKNFTFVDCVFYQNINLNSTSINSVSDFSGSQFYGEVHFENSIFDKSSIFNKTIFAKECYFQNARFRSNLDFSESIFNHNANFQGTDFYDLVLFRLAEFRESVDFSLCTYFKNASYNFCSIKNKGLFNNCRFEARLEFENIKANKIEMEECVFENEVLFNEIDSPFFSINKSLFYKELPTFSFKQKNSTLFTYDDAKNLGQKLLEIR
jgi:uncharacterized protein YjbI with pentapeptide repeats